MKRAVLCLFLVACGSSTVTPPPAPAPDETRPRELSPGQPFPREAAALVSLPDHQPIDTKGKVVLYYVFATWDLDPMHSIPKLEVLQQKYAARGFTVVALSSEDSNGDETIAHREAEILGLVKRSLGATFPVAWDRERKLVRVLRESEPLLFLVDRGGIVRARYHGMEGEDRRWEPDLLAVLDAP